MLCSHAIWGIDGCSGNTGLFGDKCAMFLDTRNKMIGHRSLSKSLTPESYNSCRNGSGRAGSELAGREEIKDTLDRQFIGFCLGGTRQMMGTQLMLVH